MADTAPERMDAATPPRRFTTMSGTPLDPVYGDPPHPGEHPYTRGIHPAMYRERLWTMRMFGQSPAAWWGSRA